MKARAATSTHKKVIITFSDGTSLQGYVNPLRLPDDPLDVLTTNGEHRQVPLKEIRAVYFVRDFTEDYEPERKAFFSRPKLDGLWVRLKFRDNETLEGVVSNDLLALLDSGHTNHTARHERRRRAHFCAAQCAQRSHRARRGRSGPPQARRRRFAGAAQALLRVITMNLKKMLRHIQNVPQNS